MCVYVCVCVCMCVCMCVYVCVCWANQCISSHVYWFVCIWIYVFFTLNLVFFLFTLPSIPPKRIFYYLISLVFGVIGTTTKIRVLTDSSCCILFKFKKYRTYTRNKFHLRASRFSILVGSILVYGLAGNNSAPKTFMARRGIRVQNNVI